MMAVALSSSRLLKSLGEAPHKKLPRRGEA